MERIFLGIKGHVVCLNKHTGEELWRRKIKTDWGKPTIVVLSEQLFVYVQGVLFCLRAEDGQVLWENPLKGLGSGSCIIAIEGKSTGADAGSTGQAVLSELVDTMIDVST